MATKVKERFDDCMGCVNRWFHDNTNLVHPIGIGCVVVAGFIVGYAIGEHDMCNQMNHELKIFIEGYKAAIK